MVSAALAVLGADVYGAHKSAGLQNGLRLAGLSQMTEAELRDVVISKHLTVYWLGPESGASYLLNAMDPLAISLTIVTSSSLVKETRASYPQIGTYVQKNAFQAVLTGGGTKDIAGFINADGNSVYYSSVDSKNVFVGFRGLDIEVQIFDPIVGESLAFAKAPGRLVPITRSPR